jgi:hypothetical protein
MSKNATRSPLRDKPLRQPGQSLVEERAKLLEDKIEPWLFMAVFGVVLAGWEWYGYFVPRSPSPWLVTSIAAGAVAFAAWRVIRLRPRMKALRLGMEGERVVGQFLDRLASKGYRVFHDVPGEGFNIDHVLIGPAGAFTIETKTRSKPVRGDARVSYDGRSISVAGFEPERDAVVQAKAQARWLSTLIAESTERRLYVRPVIVFPGWFVEAAPGSLTDVWVMEPKGLPAFIEREAETLNKEDIALLARSVALHVRACERESDK